MKFNKLECADKRGGINIHPLYNLPITPYKILGSTSELMENNKFLITKGKRKYDVLPFEKHFGNIAISQRLKDFLVLNKVSGWSCFPIEIVGLTDQYYAFQVLGKCGGIINLEEVNTSFEKPIKRQIKASSVDGNDIFLVGRTLIVLITERLADKLKKENFTNLLIEDIDDLFEFVDC